jgi:2-polyprenyl-6-methoxyphenol hydroxylase-like FAD-dependent oxidoreductase
VKNVVIIGGGLVGAMAAVMLRRRGLPVTVLEARPPGREQKVVVGEAITEGSSVFLRHELGLTEWLRDNAYRKFGFDFVTRPRQGRPPETFEECHELLLSLAPLEQIPTAFARLIPTYHVERTALNAHMADEARRLGAEVKTGASVERVVVGDDAHEVHYALDGQPATLRARWVLDCSGRRTVLGRQLGITRPAPLNTAAVWNRFAGVEADPAFWRGFHGVDRRRQTIHFTGHGFWIWWIHLNAQVTSVGVSYDKDVWQPDVKREDRGFHEMLRQFPLVARALAGAQPLEPYQYLAHLPYQSEHWISERRYALIGDAAWFTDALYSIGIETACRQLVNLAPLVTDDARGGTVCPKQVAGLNREFQLCQRAVLSLNRFKYKEGWHRPHVVMQTALNELGEIAELYHMQCASRWRPEVLARHYRLQWSTAQRLRRLERFQRAALADGERDLDGAPPLRKALLPGRIVYRVTWPLWKLPHARPWFFKLTRAWAYSERLAQRSRLWPDGLGIMAAPAWRERVRQRLAPARSDAEPRRARL